MKKEPMDFEALKKEAARRMKGQPPGKGIDTILRPRPMRLLWPKKTHVR